MYLEPIRLDAQPVAAARSSRHEGAGLRLPLTDAAIVAGASLFAGFVVHLDRLHGLSTLTPAIGFGMVCAVNFILFAQFSGLYDPLSLRLRKRDYLFVVLCWLVSIGLFVTALHLLSALERVTTGYLPLFTFTGMALLLLSRAAAKQSARVASKSREAIPSVVVGTTDELARLTSEELGLLDGIREVARLGIGDETTPDQARESITRAALAVRAIKAELVVAAIPWRNRALVSLFRLQFCQLPIRVVLLPDAELRSILTRCDVSLVQPYCIEIQRPPLSRTEMLLKRAFDVAMSFACLLLLLPLLSLVAVAIIIETPGPVLFRQSRVGWNGQVFRILKFRSMTVLEDGPDIQQAKREDARVTRIGRIIRSSSIDELPQLLNVLWGEMSIVGPRPHACAHDEKFDGTFATYAQRRVVKPGITGWAQVNGARGETSRTGQIERRIELDAWYVGNCSIWLDLEILCRTVIEVFRFRNAF